MENKESLVGKVNPEKTVIRAPQELRASWVLEGNRANRVNQVHQGNLELPGHQVSPE